MNVSISRNGVEIGEWTEAQVRSLYKEGQLLPTDYYWKEGMTEWTELPRMIKPAHPSPISNKSVSQTPFATLSNETVALLKQSDEGIKETVIYESPKRKQTRKDNKTPK